MRLKKRSRPVGEYLRVECPRFEREVRGLPRALNSILYSNTLSGKMRRVVINIFVLVKCTQYLHATILTLILLKECNHIQVVRTPFEPCATGSTFSCGKSHTALVICERFTAIRKLMNVLVDVALLTVLRAATTQKSSQLMLL